ncbi:MAG: site-specific integrase [Campylobacterota bacterium]|nr:site-specific integrase [Campylobacterota bacterium]
MSDKKLIKTDIKSLYYYTNNKDKKVYVGMAYSNKKRYKKTFTTDQMESLAMLIEFKKEIKLLANQIKFKDIFKEYLNIATPFQSIKEIKTKISRYENHLKKSLDNMFVADIKYSHLQQIINDVINVKELAPKTAKNIKQLLQVVFEFAVKQQYVNYNPAKEIIIPKFDNKMDLKITLEQARELINNIYCMDNINIRGILIMGLHGRRLGEILNLTWSQVDLEQKIYSLPWSKNKSKKNLQFSMTDWLHTVLLTRKDIAESQNMYEAHQYVFYNPNTMTKYEDISKSWAKIKELSGIPRGDFRFHDFRHLLGTYAIQILENPIEKVSHALGHSSIATTQIYVTRDKQTARTITNGFLNIFFNNLEGLK